MLSWKSCSRCSITLGVGVVDPAAIGAAREPAARDVVVEREVDRDLGRRCPSGRASSYARSACARVRGNPSRMYPPGRARGGDRFADDREHDVVGNEIAARQTARRPRCRARSPAATCARNSSPLATWGTPRRSARSSPWVPLPEPGAPSRTRRTEHDRAAARRCPHPASLTVRDGGGSVAADRAARRRAPGASVSAEPAHHLLERRGAGEEIALAEVAAEAPDPPELAVGVDPLGDDLQVERPAELDHHLQQARGRRLSSSSTATNDRSIFSSSIGSCCRYVSEL